MADNESLGAGQHPTDFSFNSFTKAVRRCMPPFQTRELGNRSIFKDSGEPNSVSKKKKKKNHDLWEEAPGANATGAHPFQKRGK